MVSRKIFYLLVAGLFFCAACAMNGAQLQPPASLTQPAAQTNASQTATPRPLDVPYVPTPPEVVDQMLKMAKVTKNDIVYDLGCGDGRIVIAAARDYGAQGVGVDLDPERVREAQENAKQAGVADRVKFIQQDLFETDLRPATVVTLYLLPAINLKLRPKLFKELKPGTRVVSHSFDMGDWKPDQTAEVDVRRIYFWVIPKDAAKQK